MVSLDTGLYKLVEGINGGILINEWLDEWYVCMCAIPWSRFIQLFECCCTSLSRIRSLCVGIKLSNPPTSEKEKRSKKVGISSFLVNIFVGSYKAVMFNFEVCSSTRIGLYCLMAYKCSVCIFGPFLLALWPFISVICLKCWHHLYRTLYFSIIGYALHFLLHLLQKMGRWKTVWSNWKS